MSRLDEALTRLERAVARLEAIFGGGKDAHHSVEAEAENGWPPAAPGESGVEPDDSSAQLGRVAGEGTEG
jgi:CAP N-terminal conserved motif